MDCQQVHSFDMAYEMYLLLAERFPLRVRAPALPSKLVPAKVEADPSQVHVEDPPDR